MPHSRPSHVKPFARIRIHANVNHRISWPPGSVTKPCHLIPLRTIPGRGPVGSPRRDTPLAWGKSNGTIDRKPVYSIEELNVDPLQRGFGQQTQMQIHRQASIIPRQDLGPESGCQLALICFLCELALILQDLELPSR